ncbi:MAG: AraC-like DNA-binding protein [Flavobacteriales bacterium]
MFVVVNDSIFDIHDVVLTFPIIECLVFVLYRFTAFKHHQLNSTLLNVFLLIVAISSIGVLVMWNEDLQHSLSMTYFLEYFVVFSLALQGPILLLYVQSFSSANFRLKAIHFFHVLPATISCIIVTAYSLDLEDLKFLNRDPNTLSHVQQVWFFVKGSDFIYAVVAIVIAWRNRHSIVHGSPQFFLTKSIWITLLLSGVFLNWAWDLVIRLFSTFVGGAVTDAVGAGHNYMFFIQINVLFLCSLFGLGRKIRIEDRQDDNVDTIDSVEPEIMSIILFEIENKQCYLEPHITLEEVSMRINIPARTVSRAVHQHFGKSFLDCINGYRIRSAKIIMLDPEKTDFTILDILYMSGFNSASSFHRYFKRLEGITPAEFRRLN